MLIVNVTGIEETRRWLSRIDQEAASALTKELRTIGNELRDEARNRIPNQAPLSNWAGAGRAQPSGLPYWDGSGEAKKQIRTIVGRGSRQRGTYRKGAVVRVRSGSPWGAVFDKVGAGGGTFVENMTRKHGPKRRALLGAFDDDKDRLGDSAQSAILKAIDQVIRKG